MNSTKKYPGKLIVIEGLDGAGKSTLIERLTKRLATDGYKTLVSRWRGSAEIGSYLKDLAAANAKLCPYAFSALHAADFADRLDREILPALAKGKIVICDRYFYTELVRDAALGLPAAWSKKLFPSAPEPDLILHLDVSLHTAFARVAERVKRGTRIAGCFNKSLRAAETGSLITSLDTTTGSKFAARYSETGEPLSISDREKMKFRFQLAVKDGYHAIFANRPGVVQLDAERRTGEVFLTAQRAIDELLERELAAAIAVNHAASPIINQKSNQTQNETL
jgi:dTMP kinase